MGPMGHTVRTQKTTGVEVKLHIVCLGDFDGINRTQMDGPF